MNPKLLGLLADFKAFFSETAEDLKVGITDLAAAFASKDIFALLKSVGFNLKTLWKGISAALKLIPNGLMRAFEELEKTGVFKGAKLAVRQIDAIIKQHPVLTKLTGVVLGGFLLWVWLSMSFVGHPGFDFDLTFVIDAFRGKFDLVDLFLSPSAMTMLTLLATGLFTGVGVAWLGSSISNLILALAFTGAKKAKQNGLAEKLKHVIPLKKV